LPRELSEHPRELARRFRLSMRRSMGQSFLVSPTDLERIAEAAGVGSGDVVVEVGTGFGRLTARLAARAAHVVSIEMDRGLHGAASQLLRHLDNVELLACDYLKNKHTIMPCVTDAVLAAAKCHRGGVKMVSNLPYGISSPAIINTMEWPIHMDLMAVTVQREVAERLLAAPRTARYGVLSVLVGWRAEIEEVFTLPPQAFWPRPEVTSTLLRIVPRSNPLPVNDYDTFKLAVHKLFQSRRKTLARALRIQCGRDVARCVLDQTGLAETARPGELAIGDYVAIADVLKRTSQS